MAVAAVTLHASFNKLLVVLCKLASHGRTETCYFRLPRMKTKVGSSEAQEPGTLAGAGLFKFKFGTLAF